MIWLPVNVSRVFNAGAIQLGIFAWGLVMQSRFADLVKVRTSGDEGDLMPL